MSSSASQHPQGGEQGWLLPDVTRVVNAVIDNSQAPDKRCG